MIVAGSGSIPCPFGVPLRKSAFFGSLKIVGVGHRFFLNLGGELAKVAVMSVEPVPVGMLFTMSSGVWHRCKGEWDHGENGR